MVGCGETATDDDTKYSQFINWTRQLAATFQTVKLKLNASFTLHQLRHVNSLNVSAARSRLLGFST